MRQVPNRRGRPLKFNRPSRTVTMTLPDDVIEVLAGTDADLGRAVVRLALPLKGQPQNPAAEIGRFGSRSVIIVPPSRELGALPAVELVPLADGRALISLDESMSAAEFELMLGDCLENLELSATARSLFDDIRGILESARRSGRTTTRRILVLKEPR